MEARLGGPFCLGPNSACCTGTEIKGSFPKSDFPAAAWGVQHRAQENVTDRQHVAKLTHLMTAAGRERSPRSQNMTKSYSQALFLGSFLSNSSPKSSHKPARTQVLYDMGMLGASTWLPNCHQSFPWDGKQAIPIIHLDAKFEKAHNTPIFQDNECLRVDPWSYSNTEKELRPLANQEAVFLATGTISLRRG